MATSKINIKDTIRKVSDKAWTPVEVARLNDQVLRLALFRGEYHWHNHADEDELILVYKGRIVVQFKGRPNVELAAGELIVILKGVEHCPKSLEDSYVLLYEPINLKSKGN